MTLTSDYAFENSFRKRFRSFVRAGLCWITGIDMHKRRSRRPRLPLGVILADTDANRQMYGDRFIDDMNKDNETRLRFDKGRWGRTRRRVGLSRLNAH